MGYYQISLIDFHQNADIFNASDSSQYRRSNFSLCQVQNLDLMGLATAPIFLSAVASLNRSSCIATDES
jgi:hypothetical protein